MRTPRIKVDAAVGEAVYHCMTRTVNKERLFDDTAKEVLRRQLWLLAEYCGIDLLTYIILSNHFHVLAHVPHREIPSDAELLRRHELLYPKPTRYQAARLAVIRSQLESNGPEAVTWRRRQLALMGDISQFMKLLKQRFSIWFNKNHDRVGTLWSERFKSILVEPRGRALQTMAAYIDLNAIRAGLVEDPKDYRFSGYAEAVAGNDRARQGIVSLMGAADWEEAQAGYRQMIFGTGAQAREHKHAIGYEDFERVMREGGKLPLANILRCRLRYFSDGAVLGSRAFVTEQLAAYRERTGRRKQTEPRPVPGLADWGDLVTMRGLRGKAIG